VRTLFDLGAPPIDGFKYEPEFITVEEERSLVAGIQQLTFGAVTFRGVEAKRRVVQLGWDYQFATRTASPATPVPDFLRGLQQRAGAFAGVPPESLEEVLVTEYQPGAAIGWHRDAPPFGLIVGVSLVSSCKMRLKPPSGSGAGTVAIELAPRSAYLFSGAVRSEWQHMIPPAKTLRYSITLRTIREKSRG
jgi:alkylated DNA repair dioxygenase AlkB